jgi:ssDNA-specific exonuclease RecJ
MYYLDPAGTRKHQAKLYGIILAITKYNIVNYGFKKNNVIKQVGLHQLD